MVHYYYFCIYEHIYIYLLKNSLTNEVRYVGQTNNPGRRLNRHITNSKANKDNRHISNWIRSLEDLPIMVIIEVCDYSIRNEREQHWINHYKNLGCDLCNCSNGGAGAGICNKNSLGRIVSEETKSKISKANLGNKHAKGNKGGGSPKTIYQYDKTNNLIAVYKSIKDASKATGLNRTTIRRNIKNISSSKLFTWTDKPLH